MQEPEATAASFGAVRALTEAIAAPLSPEDQTAQSMPDVSPTKWHRAHTTWFFEEFVLAPTDPGYARHHPSYGYLFNSYYEAIGERHPRAARGVVTRPGAAEVGDYRAHVDAAMGALLDLDLDPSVATIVELGLHHEQQHQELMLMDVKHVLSCNVLDPVYRPTTEPARRSSATIARPAGWWGHPGGEVAVGHDGEAFAFDNERPRHAALAAPFELATAPVTDADVLAFIDDGGYRRPELWLSEGWATVQAQGWTAPLYWAEDGDSWSTFTLAGRRAVDPASPACHLSYFEADAIARWADARLPTEVEWEVAASAVAAAGHVAPANLLDLDVLHPRAALDRADGLPAQLLGDVWEWTSSAYLPYPGFRTAPGAVGEYNGKFMVNQHVLRGGSCVTPPGHVRATYRNFFPPHARWAFSGARLARDLDAVSDAAVQPVRIDVHLDAAAWRAALADDARRTLADRLPHLEPVWFYDEHGSDLFDQITRLPEYYPTRTERALLEAHAAEIAAGGHRTLAELGSGTSDKTRILLDALRDAGTLERYVPFDVSEETLRAAADAIATRYPGVTVHGIVGDFHRHLGEIPSGDHRLLAFLGSTIGNLDPDQRRCFLEAVRDALGPTDRFLLGIDLVKDPAVLVAAYDDAAGVTAEFDRNALAVLNREVGTNFDPEAFDHVALWDPACSRIEMRLRARRAQVVHVPGGTELALAEGDELRTEISTKFTVEAMTTELAEAGFEVERTLLAPDDAFALLLARPVPRP